MKWKGRINRGSPKKFSHILLLPQEELGSGKTARWNAMASQSSWPQLESWLYHWPDMASVMPLDPWVSILLKDFAADSDKWPPSTQPRARLSEKNNTAIISQHQASHRGVAGLDTQGTKETLSANHSQPCGHRARVLSRVRAARSGPWCNRSSLLMLRGEPWPPGNGKTAH